jgi:hypothetical protein
MTNILSDSMTLAGRHLAIHYDMKFRALAMSHPADGNVVDFHNILHA